MNQNDIWKIYSRQITISDIIENYYHPASFQRELAFLINNICSQYGYQKVIEVGCETGITSMLLRENLEKTFFDLDEEIISKVRIACERIGQKGNFVVGDMFSMNFPDKSFDLVFNSGVIEHFGYKERVVLLKEYGRLLKDKGTLLLGFPNHYSFPYRSAYLLKKKLLFGFSWPWPKEYKIYDLKKELREAGLQLVNRQVISKESVFEWWNFSGLLKKILKSADRIFKFEGYLTVVIIRK